MKKTLQTVVCLLVSLVVRSTHALDRVEIRISDSARGVLEADPYWSDKVPATWIAGSESTAVAVSYRGAYTLQSQLRIPDGPRNWKVKTPKVSPYRGLREWNFNAETHLRQKLSLDLFSAASVPALPSRNVLLYVNGKRQGTYLEFPDPDNKVWLASTFGSDAGDLYKAATDIPGSLAFFGELTDRGDQDSSYWRHYQKKSNNDGPDSLDYTRLREFIVWVNRSTDLEFEQGLLARFDLHAFLRYLVVANFSSHWDAYPNRGKNFWLYHDPSDGRWRLLPWDVDGTFQSEPWCLDNMGPTSGLFFMEWPVRYCPNARETRSRPLLERVFRVEAWKRMYIGEYQKALGTYLNETAILKRLDSLEGAMQPALSSSERPSFDDARSDMRAYIAERTDHVAALLAKYPTYDPTPLGVTRRGSVRPVATGPWIDVRGRKSSNLDQAPSGIWRRLGETRAIVH